MNRPSLVLAAGAGWLVVLLAVAAPAVAAPTASFTVSPDPPVAGQAATFTSTSTVPPGQTIATTAWDFDGDNTFETSGEVVPHTFASAGPVVVRLHVVNNVGQEDTVTRTIDVAQPPLPPPPTAPVADFTFDPAVPVAGSAATFTSTSSTVAGASIPSAGVQWDFENDGAFDASGSVVDHVFATPGVHTVGVKVEDSRGLSATTTHVVVVNDPPTAAFTAVPGAPTIGDEVTLTSYSSDTEGALAAQQWDLDGDGDFGDASGAVVIGTFTAAGDHRIALRVRDGQGATSTVSKTITVLPLKKSETPASTGDPLKAQDPPFVTLVSPFPIVRLVGAVVRNGARIRLLSVRAPAGSRVYVKCRGARCPAGRLTRVVGAKPVRFRALERYLPAGSVLEILVRRGDQIGKYTKFRIRRHRVPRRTDGCLPPSTSHAVKCPTG